MTYLISFILLVLPTYLIRFQVFGIPSTVLEIIIYLVFLIGLNQAIKNGFRRPPIMVWLPIALLVLAAIVSTVISPDKRMALGELKGFLIDPILFFWLLFQFGKREKINFYLGALTLDGLFVAIHTIIQRLLGNVTPDGRVIGIFGYSPNYLALFLAPIAVMVFAWGFDFIKNRQKISYSFLADLVFLILILAIYFSGSRGGILSIGFGMATFLIVNYWAFIKERWSSKVIVGILIVVAIVISWQFLKPNFNASSSAGRVASSNNVRWLIWKTSVELGAKHPILGVGLGNYQKAFTEFTKDRVNYPEFISPLALTPHNVFMTFWLNTGILGLISFLGLLAAFYLRIAKRLFDRYGGLFFAVFSSMVIYGLVEAIFWKNDLSMLFFFFWGISWVL